MLTPNTPNNERQRVAALGALNVLDTEPAARFDRITRLAHKLFNVPIALVSLVDTDRQWFKSCYAWTSDLPPETCPFAAMRSGRRTCWWWWTRHRMRASPTIRW